MSRRKTDMLRKEEYLASSGNICPYCQSVDIAGLDGIDSSEAGIAAQVVGCNSCDKRWLDIYRLVDVEPL